MNVRCWLYRALDRFRFTAAATKAFYHGEPVRILRRACTVEGIVIRVVGSEADGDVTFDLLLDDGTQRHVEVTPCAPSNLRRIAQGMPTDARVRVSGDERFDPAHRGDGGHVMEGGWTEIHPCTGIEVLSWARKS